MRRTTRLKKPQVPEIEDLYRFDDLGGRPKYGGVEMTHETDIPTYETIMEEVDGKIAVEADARSDEDAALQENIDGEVLARQGADAALQSQIDAVVASSDVKDIVGTYAALEAYDTSTLGDNDIIKVLQDETHQDETTYYRWVLADEEFSLIGEEGPYYTKAATDALLNNKADKATTYTKTETDAALALKADKATTYTKTETDTLLGGKQDTLTAGDTISIVNDVINATNTGMARELTSADYNEKWASGSTENDCVALWKLPRGTYLAPIGIKRKCASGYVDSGNQTSSYLVTGDENYTIVVAYDWNTVGGTPAGGRIYQLTNNAGTIKSGYPQNILTSGLVKNTLTETYAGYILAAPQGKVLADRIGDLSTLTTTDKTSAVAAINEIAAGSGGVIELTTADYNYPTNNPTEIALWLLDAGTYAIQNGASVEYAQGWTYNGTDRHAQILNGDRTNGVRMVLSGGSAGNGLALTVSQTGATITSAMYFDVFRGLNAVNWKDEHTPLSAYQGKVLNDKIEGRIIQNAGAPTTSTVGTVGKLLEDTTNGKLYICTDATNPYVWEEVGGGGSVATINSTDWSALWQ